MYTYMHFSPQIRSGIRKFQDLMNGPLKFHAHVFLVVEYSKFKTELTISRSQIGPIDRTKISVLTTKGEPANGMQIIEQNAR